LPNTFKLSSPITLSIYLQETHANIKLAHIDPQNWMSKKALQPTK